MGGFDDSVVMVTVRITYLAVFRWLFRNTYPYPDDSVIVMKNRNLSDVDYK